MQFTHSHYIGTGVNHDNEQFEGKLTISNLSSTGTQSMHYICQRISDGEKVHEELALLTTNENGDKTLHLHMEELPSITVHSLSHNDDAVWTFSYTGTGQLEGFNSELVFEWDERKVKYLHRWAVNGEVGDKSWCLLEPVNLPDADVSLSHTLSNNE